ncbi:3692_t:CDS:2 [Funneliformis mosseae]|uniref:3692_t:CDS:1 n=1 Tax=Funneliformis mosseae TaxID=27381 RepID=A0A9N8VQH2_FUNMO|nr:3692_t:CDS:2 [Funneliformis mosseae]
MVFAANDHTERSNTKERQQPIFLKTVLGNSDKTSDTLNTSNCRESQIL